ncbi:ABC transporter ATP-binding protein [Paramuribaculum intestinale]|uniref:ABC transporter ATP-binding protein n=1 Tax=Paramuribaculum intestinale TaxID=2094151 RepID=UPI0025A9B5C2|nr:ABC transporter ATP-binding protein [Paramuribaculum intestinale]
MIQIKQLNKVFRTSDVETQALNNVNLDIAKGDFVAIMGPSGCGKSTLLNIIGLLDNPTSGNYLLDGIEMGSLKESQRTSQRKGRIGFVFQSFNLIDELTVAENIELPLTYLGVPKKERRIKVDNLLQRLNLSHRSRHYPQQLSGGQQQRVAIARAIVGDPVILLADEPTGNLDSSNGREVMELLTSLNREGTTIVMVTHSQRDASYARRTINLFDGSVVTDETAERDTVNDDRHKM